ncbi:MAG: hypothetical protein ABH879_02445 [archaeon]
MDAEEIRSILAQGKEDGALIQFYRVLKDDYLHLVNAYNILLRDCQAKLELLYAMGDDWDHAHFEQLRGHLAKLVHLADLDKGAEAGEESYVLHMAVIIDRATSTEHSRKRIGIDEKARTYLLEFRRLLEPLNRVISQQIAFFRRYRNDYTGAVSNRDALKRLIYTEARILGDPQRIKAVDSCRNESYILLMLKDVMINTVAGLGDDFGFLSPEEQRQRQVKLALMLLEQERNPGRAFRLFAKYVAPSLRDIKVKVLYLHILYLFSIACSEYASITKDLSCLDYAIQHLAYESGRYKLSCDQRYNDEGQHYYFLHKNDINGYYEKDTELPQLIRHLQGLCEDYKRIRRDYYSYTLKARLIINNLEWIPADFMESALADMETARDAYPNHRSELLKFEAQMRARFLQNTSFKGEITPDDRRWKRVGNLLSADDAISEVISVISDFSVKRNRERFAWVFRKAGYREIVGDDFLGAIWQGAIPEYREHVRRLGLKIYPITVLIAKDKWRELRGKRISGVLSKLDLDDWVAGVNLHSWRFPYPFNRVGGVRLLSYDGPWKKILDVHEDVHGSFALYSYSDDPVVNEMLSFSYDVDSGERMWWCVADSLINHYIEHYKRLYSQEQIAKLPSDIQCACDAMNQIKRADRRMLSRALMRCQNLGEVAGLCRLSPFMEEAKRYKEDWAEAGIIVGHLTRKRRLRARFRNFVMKAFELVGDDEGISIWKRVKPGDMAEFKRVYNDGLHTYELTPSAELRCRMLQTESENGIEKIYLKWRRDWIKIDEVLSAINYIVIKFKGD